MMCYILWKYDGLCYFKLGYDILMHTMSHYIVKDDAILICCIFCIILYHTVRCYLASGYFKLDYIILSYILQCVAVHLITTYHEIAC